MSASCLCSKSHRGKTSRLPSSLLFVLILLAAWFTPGAAKELPSSKRDIVPTLTVSYYGLDKIHFSYTSDHAIKITASIAGGDEETIIDYGAPSSGSHNHTGLPQTDSSYNITYRIYRKEIIDEQEVDVLENTIGATMTNHVTGQMLYDDAFDTQTFILGPVSVPNGRSLEIKKSVITDFDDVISTGGEISIQETEFKESNTQVLLINQASTTEAHIEVKKCTLFDVNIKGAVNLIENEMRNLLLIKRSASNITSNIFTGAITPWGDNSSGSWVSDWGSAGATPQIENNVFLGMHAFRIQNDFPVSPPIPLGGSNSFGDIQGPSLSTQWHYDYNNYDFLKSRGALIQTAGFTIETYVNVLRYPKKIPVDVFALNWIVGQNTISHHDHGNWGTQFEDRRVLLTDRETLLSLDVASTKPLDATIIATLDGTEIYRGTHSLNRYYGDYSGAAGSKYTVNIILPPVSADDIGESVTKDLVVYWDSTGVDGWQEHEGEYPLLSTPLTFTPGPTRPFRVGVIPIHAYAGCSGKAGAGGVLPYLSTFFPAMFPVRKTDMVVDVRPHMNIYCGPQDYLASEFLIPEIATSISLSNNFVTNWWSGTNPYDRYVAVVPPGALGDEIEGGSQTGMRDIIIVNERYPSSVLHEMGHSAGIDYEEYSTANPDGYPVTDSTIFDPTGASTGVTQERFEHMPGDYTSWGQSSHPIYDIMSRMSVGVWPRYTTLRHLYDYFNTITASAAKTTARQNAARQNAAPSGARQVLLYGKIEQGDYPIKAIFSDGYPQIFDITGLGLQAENSAPQPFEIDPYDLKGYTADGALAYQAVFTTSYGYLATYWARTYTHIFTIPDNVTRLQVIRQATGETRLDRQIQPGAAAALLSPKPGDTLGSTVTLQWNAASKNLLKEVYLSYDGGANWQPVGLPVSGDRLTLETDFMTAGNNLSIRTIASDGFRNSLTQVDGLALPDRPPEAQISFPQDGDIAPPGYRWNLSALMFDLDQTSGLTGAWTSSIAGALGSGANLWGVALPPGKQTLTFTASDGAGNTAARSVQVTVQPVTQADLKITADSLRVAPYTGGDFWGDGTPVLNKGSQHTARLELRGVGVPITATVALYLAKPDGSETLLTRSDLAFAPFELKTLSANFVPETHGIYYLRAAIETATLPDPVAANNQASWRLCTWSLKDIYLPQVNLKF